MEKPGFWWKSRPDLHPFFLIHLPYIGDLGNDALDMVISTGETVPDGLTGHKAPGVVRRFVHRPSGISTAKKGAHVGDEAPIAPMRGQNQAKWTAIHIFTGPTITSKIISLLSVILG